MSWRCAIAAALWTAALGLVLAGPIAAFADSAPTAAQIAACAPDALRLCADAIPNPAAVKACMLRHRALLSPQCREAFPK